MDSVAQAVRDRAEIEECAYMLGKANDARTPEGFRLYAECMTPDVLVEYEFGSWRGVARHIEQSCEIMLSIFTFTHHLITNPIIKVDGDTATAEYRVTAAHGVERDGVKKVIFGGSTYRQKLIRTEDGWRINHHHCDKSWIDDDGGVIAACMQQFLKRG